MDEYIKREEAIEAVKHAWAKGLEPSQYLEIIPAADVAPVLHGRWVEKEKYTFGIMYDCSLCENRILDNGHSWNYCPNCGAIMNSYKQENKR